MPVTVKLRRWAEDNLSAKKSATDAQIMKQCKKAMLDGTLDEEDFVKMVSSKSKADDDGAAADDDDDDDDEPGDGVSLTKGMTDDELDRLADRLESRRKAGSGNINRVLGKAMGASENDAVRIRVKGAVERFSNTKTAMVYKSGPRKGEPILVEGRSVDVPSDRRKALWAAWFKYTALPHSYLTEHDKDLVKHIIHNETFVGHETKTSARFLTDGERAEAMNRRYEWDDHLHQKFSKAPLINDGDGGTSGGYYMTPEFFDFDAIILPVLQREISPLVSVVTVPRGAAARGFRMGNPTFGTATAEGTADSIFDATGFVSGVDTSFHRAFTAFEYGQNFEEDAVPQFAALLQDAISRKAGEYLDSKIAGGNGTTEILGILNASGVIDVTPSTAGDGIATVSDAVNLFFAVPKAFKNEFGAQSQAYAGNEQTYAKFRSIQVGAGDQRLVFGDDDLDNYQLLKRKFAVEENSMTANDVIFGVWGAYRLYARQGVRFRASSNSRDDILRNTTTIVADMRYGGRPIRGDYFAVIDDL